MKLIIQIRDGQPHEHPIFLENFVQAFPNIDIENLPPEFAVFERVAPPSHGAYEVVEGPEYVLAGGVVKDVWSVRPMTEAERAEKVEQLIIAANQRKEFLIAGTQQIIQECTTESIKQMWEAYLAELNAWVLVDPDKPLFPMPPRTLADGTIVANNSPGTVPSVTG